MQNYIVQYITVLSVNLGFNHLLLLFVHFSGIRCDVAREAGREIFRTHLRQKYCLCYQSDHDVKEKHLSPHSGLSSSQLIDIVVVVTGVKEMQYKSVPLSLLERGWDIWMGLTLTSSKKKQNTREFRGMWVAVSCCCHGDVGD